MNFLQTLLAFGVALGVLITFHELGHYWMARWCGVKVLRFSVGMGKVVFARRFGPDQTEWAVSLLPLGGYVKMLDAREQDLTTLSEADLKREFTRQSVWRRMAIVAAGPMANFLLAGLVFAGLYLHGVAEPSTKLGAPAASTAAFAAGVQGGDRVTAVNGKAVTVWSELRWQIIEAAIAKHGAQLTVARAGGALTLTVPAVQLAGLDLDSDVLDKLGLALGRPQAVLGQIAPDGAAARAGLLRGDEIISVDGKPVADGLAFIEQVRAARGSIVLVVRRAAQLLTLTVWPEFERNGGLTIGKIKAEVGMAPEMIVLALNPLDAVAKAGVKVWDSSVLSVKMVGRMMSGEVSWKNLSGPITIADYAGQTARAGAISYLSFIAFISISLGVMNLLPIPVLDGGLLLYYSLEVLTGRPLPQRLGELGQRLGVGLLLAMMALAVFNDLARLLL